MLRMLRLKGCPKCGGDVVLDRDQWGWYEQCIQCGYLHDLPDVVGVKPLQAQEGNGKKKLSKPRKRQG